MDPETDLPAPVVEPGSAQTPVWESDDNPYKQRFETYRTEADRRATTLSTYERNLEDLRSGDLERQRAAAEALQIELVTDEADDTGYVDPYEELAQRQAALEARIVANEQARQTETATATVEARLDSLDLDDGDKDLVLARAIAMPAGEDGLPDVSAAYEQLQARDNARMEKAMKDWAAGKRPVRGVAPGTPATEQKNIMDMTDEERVEWAVRRLDDSA